MDAVLLSRIQFGLTAGFHFIFPPLTLGLTWSSLLLKEYHIKPARLFMKKYPPS